MPSPLTPLRAFENVLLETRRSSLIHKQTISEYQDQLISKSQDAYNKLARNQGKISPASQAAAILLGSVIALKPGLDIYKSNRTRGANRANAFINTFIRNKNFVSWMQTTLQVSYKTSEIAKAYFDSWQYDSQMHLQQVQQAQAEMNALSQGYQSFLNSIDTMLQQLRQQQEAAKMH